MHVATTFWPETPNRYAHTVEVVLELPTGELVAFDLVMACTPAPWFGWFTAEGNLVRMVAPGVA